ncbi:hypothetical protein KPL37_16815 [Clostridium frigoris]|uniref:Uncharacterized protein n=1 Tax=Clostridium frigoris TaxID=205327 RepID=A0ABS6BXN8_9CLOT|nr:hypothetical protein [Clostridium frigoris]MBU3161372.1 hypothetical protein [Clostridium frigoris]
MRVPTKKSFKRIFISTLTMIIFYLSISFIRGVSIKNIDWIAILVFSSTFFIVSILICHKEEQTIK